MAEIDTSLETITYVPDGIEEAYDLMADKVTALLGNFAHTVRYYGGGEYKPVNKKFILDCIFVPNFLEGLKKKKYANLDPEIRLEAQKAAIKKIPIEVKNGLKSLKEAIENMRVSTPYGDWSADIHRDDIIFVESTPGYAERYALSQEHKSRFIEKATVTLTNDEMGLYRLLLVTIPALRIFRDKGFNIDRLMQTYVNRYSNLNGDQTLEDLPRDIHRFYSKPVQDYVLQKRK